MLKVSQLVKGFLAVAIILSSVSVFAITEKSKQALIERMTPAGQACVAGNPKCEVAVASGEARSAKVVYDAACTACHSTGAAGAPILGDKAAWSARIAKGKSTLHDHGINGFNAMPAKGACGSCSDEEIIAAVDYMISSSK